jgi:PGF-CTERM protein
MTSKKLFSAFLATFVILSIVAGSTVAFAQKQAAVNVTKNVTIGEVKSAAASIAAKENVTKGAVASAVASAAGGFLGLPGFEALYAIAGLLVVAYLVIRLRK